MTDSVPIYLEIGKKRVFACALEWPGWARAGSSEAAAVQALFDYTPRFASALDAAGIEFTLPAGVGDFQVVERLEGDATTDFGAPGAIPAADLLPQDAAAFERQLSLLLAYWGAFDRAVRAAGGLELRKGPRGGGRELDEIREHVLAAEVAYLSRLGWKAAVTGGASLEQQMEETRLAILAGLEAGARRELPTQGPRGGKVWPPRYFVRRTAWHALDHAWEIEDRMLAG